MTPPDWSHRHPSAPLTGATAPLTGARGTVRGYKTKTKKRMTQDFDIRPKTRGARQLAAARHAWNAAPPISHRTRRLT